MPSIRIEAKNVTYQGQDTGYDHSYLLLDDNDIPDVSDIVARGGSGSSGSIEIQVGLAIEDSLDARKTVTPMDRGSTLVLDTDVDARWSLMVQAADQIASVGIGYTLPGEDAVVRNSNSVVATLLHAVGMDISDSLPTNSSFNELVGAETILDFERNLVGGDASDLIVGWKQDDQLAGGGGNDNLRGGEGADILYGNQGSDRLDGGDGNDQLFGGQGDDTLTGGAGDDILEGGKGINMLNGGDGVDTASYANAAQGFVVSLLLQEQAQITETGSDFLSGFENLLGSSFGDTLTGDSDTNVLTGAAGDDTLTSGYGNDTAYGGSGADTIFGNQGNDTLYGNEDSDWIHGGQNDDVIYGGKGDDILNGGVGNDQISGNLNDDLFIFMANFGRDVVTDFSVGSGNNDRIQFGAGTFADYTDVQAHMTQEGMNVVLQLDAGNSVTLFNTTTAVLTADHFLFM
jgi:Ca2+-binding RTX toxin-like protein